MSERWEVIHDEALAALSAMPAASADACLCDPPYGLRFLANRWDYSLPSVALWEELLRVLKPGAPLLAFGGSRTFHRLTCGIEDAGFEIRDTICWLYGEGFPKSLDVSKAIDKASGIWRGRAGVAISDNASMGGPNYERTEKGGPVTAAAAAAAGYGTALKPGWEPCILARRPPEGGVLENLQAHGVGPLNIDGARVGRAAHGRWPANVVLSHHAGCVPAGTARVRGSSPMGPAPGNGRGPGFGHAAGRGPEAHDYTSDDGTELVVVSECVPDCPVRILDRQAGARPSTLSGRADPSARHANPGDNSGASLFGGGNSAVYADGGGPSRFYFCAKVSTSEREDGCSWLPVGEAGKHNTHPTLKPIDLTTWLATLVKPPSANAIMLVPFSGAGSEMIGALRAGWHRVIGIEAEAEHCGIARARIAMWTAGGTQEPLFAGAR